MTPVKLDEIVDDYMKRLEASLASMPPGRRKELTLEISEHIAQARSQLKAETEADVLTILERLGEPDEIAVEARDGVETRDAGMGALDVIALLLMAVGGGLFPIAPIAWVIATGLVWRSKAWTPRQKFYGDYLPLVVALGLLLIGAISAGLPPHDLLVFVIAVLLGSVVLPFAAAIYLAAVVASRIHLLVWIGAAIVVVAVYLPAAATLIPPRADVFIGPDGPPGSAQPAAGVPGCGAVYATLVYAPGLPLYARAPVNVGVCWDGRAVAKRWGPDCYPEFGPGLVVNVQQCKVTSEPDGSLVISIESRAHALTAPFFTTSAAESWIVRPDGRVTSPGGH